MLKLFLSMSMLFAFVSCSFGQMGEMKFKKEELASKVINKKAPDFKLKDLQGKTVSLSALKGKVVVVDFWATWCGPCIASFSAMQLVVNKYKDSSNVVFLFVDTWESQETQKERVSEVASIIKEAKVNFKVLLDEKVKGKPEKYDTALKYQAENIPTKIVIGKDGNIKFRTVGYNGSKEYIMQEMSAMIAYAGK